MATKGTDVRDQNGAVLTCMACDCSYNQRLECWAPEVRVGEGHPSCDTFTKQYSPKAARESAVTTCGVTGCNFNDQEECVARGVTLSPHSGHADCVTFRA